MSRKKDLVVYEKNNSSLTTLLDDDFKCIYSGEQYAKTDIRIMKLDVAIELIEIVDNKSMIKSWRKISYKNWDDALCVLPPMRWEDIKEVNIFAMSEMMTSDITAFYISYKKKYYTTYRRLRDSNTKIVDGFLEQIKKVK